MPIRLSANLGFLWNDLPHLERIERAAKAGFKAIEMHWPYDVPAADILAAARKHGMAIVGINTPRGNVEKGDSGLAAQLGREAEFWQAFQLSLDYAKVFDSCAIHVMAGKVPPAQFDAGRSTYLANLTRASAEAAKAGVMLMIEPLNEHDAPGNHLSVIEDAAAVVEVVGAPNLKIMFDCYHVARQSGDVTRRLKRFYPLVGHIQIAGVPDRAEPDSSELDYRFIFAEIEKLGWPGHVGVEYRPRGSVEAGLGWIKDFGLS